VLRWGEEPPQVVVGSSGHGVLDFARYHVLSCQSRKVAATPILKREIAARRRRDAPVMVWPYWYHGTYTCTTGTTWYHGMAIPVSRYVHTNSHRANLPTCRWYEGLIPVVHVFVRTIGTYHLVPMVHVL
jgi:hypothetical protein